MAAKPDQTHPATVRSRAIHVLTLCALIFFFAATVIAGASKPVMVHYMPWFQAEGAYSSAWGYHWTMNYFNPNLFNPTNGEREVASWYYPQTGPYDSLDPTVLEYQVLLMKLGGIDGVIVDWYGPDNYYDYAINNQRTLALFNYTRKAGLKFSLCYEDSTIQAEISGGPMNGVSVTAATAIAHAQQTLLYVQTNFFTDPSYLRLNNAPVFLNFGPQYFYASSNWTSIFSVLNPTNQPAFFTEDNRLAPAGTGAFDWPPMSLSRTNPQSPVEPVLSDATLTSYLASFDQNAAAWPAFVSSAFPRFHDIYAQAGVGNSYGYLDDQSGNTFRETLARAMTNHSALVQIVTWNDYGEGTIVEPTVAGTEPTTEYGFFDLGIVQDFRRQYLDASFPCQTNDLALPLRLYNQRQKYAASPSLAAEMDRIFTNIIAGNLTVASLQLTGLETTNPVIYNLSYTSHQLQFSIGGYLGSTVQVEMSTNLTVWQTVRTIATSTNQPDFATNALANQTQFFKIQ
jgi:hypothetical protein